MKMRTKRKIAAALVLVLLLGTAFGGTLVKLAKEATFYWFEHTETELKVKAFAEENGVLCIVGAGSRDDEAAVTGIFFDKISLSSTHCARPSFVSRLMCTPSFRSAKK